MLYSITVCRHQPLFYDKIYADGAQYLHITSFDCLWNIPNAQCLKLAANSNVTSKQWQGKSVVKLVLKGRTVYVQKAGWIYT